MTGEELTVLAERAYGKSWKPQLARDLGVYLSTINRWVTGFTPISRKNELAIRGLCANEHQSEVA